MLYIRAKLFRLVKWLDTPVHRRYWYLMVRDKGGIERWERTQTLNLRRLTGKVCDRLLGIK
jgi:hypothetical protein